jgi:hypothetical protein
VTGPDYRTAAEYFRDKAHAEKRERLDGTAKTPAKRQQEFRRRNKEAGRVAVTVYVRPEYREAVRDLEARCQFQETFRCDLQEPGKSA